MSLCFHSCKVYPLVVNSLPLKMKWCLMLYLQADIFPNAHWGRKGLTFLPTWKHLPFQMSKAFLLSLLHNCNEVDALYICYNVESMSTLYIK